MPLIDENTISWQRKASKRIVISQNTKSGEKKIIYLFSGSTLGSGPSSVQCAARPLCRRPIWRIISGFTIMHHLRTEWNVDLYILLLKLFLFMKNGTLWVYYCNLFLIDNNQQNNKRRIAMHILKLSKKCSDSMQYLGI